MDDAVFLQRALTQLGHVLRDRGLAFHIAIVGGSALLLAGEGRRPTGDVDVVAVAAGTDQLTVTWQLTGTGHGGMAR